MKIQHGDGFFHNFSFLTTRNNILEQIFNAEIEVNCECIIERTYDYTNLNEVEK